MSEDRLKIAVFVDFDNIEIGVKNTLSSYFDMGAVLEAIKERGEVVTKVAYGDWTRAGDYGRAMSQHAVHMVQRNLTPGGDKNGADINLALDALEMAFTHSHINSFVIVSGDSDFISLVEKLKQYDRKVFVVGGRAFTSVVMQKNCTEFIAYENIVGRGRGQDRARSGGETNLSQAMPLVRRALKLLADREVVPQLGLLKSTLLQLDSAFSEREYGAGSFRDFIQKLAKAGFVTLKGSERSFHVELREGGDGGAASAGSHAPLALQVVSQPSQPAATPREEGAAPAEESAAEPAISGDLHPQGDVVAVIQSALTRATVSRWPLYVRQVKQLIKVVDGQFDERRYGFATVIEALRYCQREGVVRVERDRQGIVRVWPGAALQRPADVVEALPVATEAQDAAPSHDAPAGAGNAAIGAAFEIPDGHAVADTTALPTGTMDGDPGPSAERAAHAPDPHSGGTPATATSGSRRRRTRDATARPPARKRATSTTGKAPGPSASRPPRARKSARTKNESAGD